MLLNFTNHFYNILYTQFVFYTISLTIKKYCECFNTYDTTTRINLNVFFWDLMYFSWTNINYIFLLLVPLLLFSYSMLFSNRVLVWIQQVYLALAAFCIIQLTLSVGVCTHFNYTPIKLDHYNALLINGLNKYHPFILYAAWMLLLSTRLISAPVNKSFATHKFKTQNNSFWLIPAFYYIVATLALGSWWAYQEGSWGGWWNWDPSEVFGLYIMLLLSHNLHQQFKRASNALWHTLSALGLLSSVIYYCFMQVNFSLISHNFGFRDSDFVDIRVFYTLLVLAVTLISISVTRSSLLTNNHHSLLTAQPNYVWYQPAVALLLALIICFSVIVLINDLAWKVMGLNTSNIIANYQAVTLSIILVYLSLFYKFNITTFCWFCLSILFIGIESLLLPVVYLVTISSYTVIHVIILTSLITSFLWSNFVLSNWAAIKTSSLHYLPNFNFTSNIKLSTQHPFITEAFSIINQTAYTSYLHSTSPDVKTFSLPMSALNTCQGLISDHATNLYTFLSDNKSTTSLLSTVIIYLFLVMKLVYKPKPILI